MTPLQYILAIRHFRIVKLFVLRFGSVTVGLLTNVLWARYASQELYGQYQVVMSILVISGAICLPGLAESFTISGARGYDGNLRKLLFLQIGSAVIGSMGIASFAFLINKRELFYPLLVGALFFPAYQLLPVCNGWMTGRGEVTQVFYNNLIVSLGILAILAVLLYSGVHALSLILAGTLCVYGAVSIFLTGRICASRKNEQRDAETVEYGYHSSITAAFSALIPMDKVLLNQALPATAVAIYSIAMVFPDQIRGIYSVVNQVLTPRLYASRTVSEAWCYLRSRLGVIYLSFTMIGVAGLILIPILVPVFFSQKYVDAIPYGKWLWLSLALSAPLTYFGNALRGQRKIGFIYFVSVFYPLGLLIAYFLMIDRGIAGLVSARIIMIWFISIIYCMFFVYYILQEKKSSHQDSLSR